MDTIPAIQQDTIPIQQLPDTLKETNEGIDPLFLMIERKTQEVEAIKEQVSIQKQWAAKQKTIPKVDTTCHICPSSNPIPLHSIVELSKPSKSLFNIEPLYDKNYFFAVRGNSKPVFIETKQTIPGQFKDSFKINPLKEDVVNPDWFFYPLLVLLVLAGVIRTFFANHITILFRSSLFFFISNKLKRERTGIWDRAFIILDSIFFISMPLLVVLTLNYFGIWLEYSMFSVMALTFTALLGFRILRYLFLKFLGFLTNQTEAFNTLRFNQLVYARTTGITFVPLLILFAYTDDTFQEIIFYILIATASFYLIFSIIRTFQVFIFKGFSIFYLILYLCALEIIPILIIYKEIFGE